MSTQLTLTRPLATVAKQVRSALESRTAKPAVAASLVLIAAVLVAAAGGLSVAEGLWLRVVALLFDAAAAIVVVHALSRRAPATAAPAIPPPPDTAKQRIEGPNPAAVFSEIAAESLSVTFGSKLASRLIEGQSIKSTLERFDDVRREIARETGIVIPGMRLRSDPSIDPTSYRIAIHGECVADGTLRDGVLVLAEPAVLDDVEGEPADDPVYGLVAKWVDPPSEAVARALGALTFDNISIVASHVAQAARDDLAALFGRQECERYIEYFRMTHPALIREIGTALIPFEFFHDTWRVLLREQAWPRSPIVAIEALIRYMATKRGLQMWIERSASYDRRPEDYQAALDELHDPEATAEALRKEIVPSLLRKRGTNPNAPFGYLSFTPELRSRIVDAWKAGSRDYDRSIDTESVYDRVESLRLQAAFVRCAPDERRAISAFLRAGGSSMPVIALDEIPSGVPVRLEATIGRTSFTEVEELPAFPA